jgi:hypothetical protein
MSRHPAIVKRLIVQVWYSARIEATFGSGADHKPIDFKMLRTEIDSRVERAA